VLKPPLGPASTSRARSPPSPHRETSGAAAGHEAGGRGERLASAKRPRRSSRTARTVRHASARVRGEARVSLALARSALSRSPRPARRLRSSSRFHVEVHRVAASSSFLAAAFSERACRVIAITCARGYVYVRTYVRECARACMRACTSGGLMGPANDYWPADLGGTSSPAGAHLHKRARVCARARDPVLH